MMRFLALLGALVVVFVLIGATNNLFTYTGQEAANKALESDLLNVARGGVSGMTDVHKFGSNPDVDTGTDPEDVWGYDSVYTFLTVGATHYISSSSAADTTAAAAIQIEVEGLDSLWASQLDTISLAGQTKTEIAGTKWVRIFRAKNISAVTFAGTVYIYTDCGVTNGVPNVKANVAAHMLTRDQQTMQAIYTIPSGKTGYLYSWYCSMAKTAPSTGLAEILLQVRTSGGVFRTQDMISLNVAGVGSNQIFYPAPRKYTEKTDIRVRIQEVSASDTGVSSGFDLILVDDS